MNKIFFLFALTGLLTTAAALPSASARELYQIEMPETLTFSGKKLLLNGMGARLATLFKVKVYIAGLYVESPSKIAETILNSPGIKKLDMKFVHDVGAGKLKDAWEEGIHKNCGDRCAALESPLKKLTSLMVDMKVGDLMSFIFYPEQVQIQIKGAEKPEIIASPDFSKALLTIWLGKEPPNASLKEGLLGLGETGH